MVESLEAFEFYSSFSSWDPYYGVNTIYSFKKSQANYETQTKRESWIELYLACEAQLVGIFWSSKHQYRRIRTYNKIDPFALFINPIELHKFGIRV